MTKWVHDVRYAIRTLSKYKAFSALAVITLALAIGANTAIVSVARAVLLDPLPYPEPSQLVTVWEDATSIGFPVNTPATGNYADWKDQSDVFQGMAATRPRSYSLTGAGNPERLQARQVTYDFFTVLRVPPMLGRFFTAEEDRPESPKAVMLSAGLWQTRFGSAANIVGSTIVLDGEPHTVVGVMPPGFDFPSKGTQIWTPIAFTPQQLKNRGSHSLRVVGRLKANVTLQQAQQQLETIARRLEKDYPETNAKVGVLVASLREELVGNTRTAVFLLMALAGCVLLIASTNLANLLLARAVSRQREIGIRIALGARRLDLVRQLFAENLVVSIVGVALGLLLAVWSFDFLSVLIPPDMTHVRLLLDTRLLVFAFLLGVITTFLFGAVPSRQAWRLGVAETLKQGEARSGEQISTHRMRNWLVVVQTAFTIVLLVAGGLMLRTFVHLRSIDPGFRGDNVLTMRTTLPVPRYRGLAPRVGFYSRVLDNIRGLPGVVDAGFTSWIPYMNWGGASSFTIEGRPEPPPGHENDSNIRLVTPGYLPAMGMRLLNGRMLTTADQGAEAVAVINETMARKFWPDDDPLNHRVRCYECPWVRIVGVVADIHQRALDVAVRPEYYVPVDHIPQAVSWAAPQDLAVRVSGDPLALVSAIRNAIWAVDPEQPIAQVRVLSDYLDEDLAPRRFQTQLIGSFAALALVLAALGVYGVLAYAVAQRRREIGIRMSLGADSSDILRWTMRQGMLPTLTGLLIGLIAAYGLAHFMTRLLYGVTPRDPLTFVLSAATLLATALLACWIPARQASRVDPGTVLHCE
jgi:putative ABC transport system permease protein